MSTITVADDFSLDQQPEPDDRPETASALQCRGIAADLRTLADRFDDLADTNPDLPKLQLYFSVTLPYLVRREMADAALVAWVDALGVALLDQPGETTNKHGDWYHQVDRKGLVDVRIYGEVSDPAERARQAELAERDARIAELEAALARAQAPAQVVGVCDDDAMKCVDCDEPAAVLHQPLHGAPEGQRGPKCERHAGPQRELLGRPVRGVVRHLDVTSSGAVA
jgi:hypothetical protein